MSDLVVTPTSGYGNACNCVSTRNNGMPAHFYNAFDTNAAQTLTISSRGSWLRPTAITGPRVLKIGARGDW